MPDISSQLEPQPINGQPSGLKCCKKSPICKILLWAGSIIIAIIIGVAVSCVVWYNIQLSPVGGDMGQLQKITVPKDSTLGQISAQLEEKLIIRSANAFNIYVRLSGKSNVLQAGIYRLSPAETIPQIVEHFVKGSVDKFKIMFYPGATLTDTTDTERSKKYDVTTVLQNAGYSDSEIAMALEKTYYSPSQLFAHKPASADLEGYVYGDTYSFNTGATVEDILSATFDEFYKVVQDNNLVNEFSSHGLNLYQGITLASIVQREINSPEGSQPSTDQKQAAQVFYSRIASGDKLGSDVTYQYISDKNGVPRDVNIDSPYNTRRYTGLPPGPIAAPGLTALLAVANPADTNYLYFLSGDDNITYFASTNAEHEANIVNHCQVKCSTP